MVQMFDSRIYYHLLNHPLCIALYLLGQYQNPRLFPLAWPSRLSLTNGIFQNRTGEHKATEMYQNNIKTAGPQASLHMPDVDGRKTPWKCNMSAQDEAAPYGYFAMSHSYSEKTPLHRGS